MIRATYFIVLSLFVIAGSLSAQTQLNATAKAFQITLEKALKTDDQNLLKKMAVDYDFVPIDGAFYVGVLALVDESELDHGKLSELKVKNDSRLQQLWSFRVPVDNFSSFLHVKGIRYLEVGEPVGPLLELALPSARVDSVHAGLGGLSQAYTGKDVIVAIIDWGFDYTHPNFYDTAMSYMRLVRAWDQNKLSGPPPPGYSFGTEYVGPDELLAAGSDTNYVFGYSSHGSHVAGIAGGTGAGTVHRGVAFDADYIFVSLRRDAPSLIDAFSYITNYAAAVNKPYVVNMSFGSHLGPHDGSSLKNMGIDILHGPGKIFVGSAGNNGSPTSNFHLDKDFSVNPNDTLITHVSFANYADMFGQTLSMWGSQNSDFSVSIRLVNNQDSTIFQTPFYSSLDEPYMNDTLLVGNDTLIMRMQSVAKHFLNDKPNIRMELKRTGTWKVILLATSANSHLHIWNNVRMNNRYTNWGMPLLGNYPGAVAGDNNFGLGEPAGVGRNVITLGSYRAKRFLPTGTIIPGNISGFSSWGPTVDYRPKPDISSTGENVFSSINSFDLSESPSNISVEHNGRTYYFKSYSGTSMSAPTVTGIVALMLEAFPKLSATQAKSILRMTARLDEYTGDIDENGHLQWGWGKANALAAVLAAAALSNSNDIQIADKHFKLYPNPAKNILYIEMENPFEKIVNIEIVSIDGKHSDISYTQSGHLITIDTNHLSAGVYLVKVNTGQSFSIQRFIISQ